MARLEVNVTIEQARKWFAEWFGIPPEDIDSGPSESRVVVGDDFERCFGNLIWYPETKKWYFFPNYGNEEYEIVDPAAWVDPDGEHVLLTNSSDFDYRCYRVNSNIRVRRVK